MKIGFEKIMGYPCSSLATKWKLQCIRPTTNTKRFRKFCVRLTHLGTNFAPISHQILHLEKKFPKVYLIRTPSVSLPTAANPALKLSKWPASRQCTNRATLYERSNHCGTCLFGCQAARAVRQNDICHIIWLTELAYFPKPQQGAVQKWRHLWLTI